MIARAALVALACAWCMHAHAGGSASCHVSSTSVAFGNYNEFATAPDDSIGNVRISCSGRAGDRVAYSILLSAGGSGSFAVRRMRSPAGYALNYNLYTTAARAIVWGDGSGGSAVVSDYYTCGGSSVTRNYPVYGRIPARQHARPGTYSDYIVVTLDF
jgi:spore coat protein U-like protein